MFAESRKYRRLPIRGFMNCLVSFQHRNKSYQGVSVLSLSAGGMYMALGEELVGILEKGDALENIQFDFEELAGLKPNGFVVHKLAFADMGGCGVEFYGLHPLKIRALDDLINARLIEFGLFE